MQRNREVKRTLICVLILNWLVASAKLVFGFIIRSGSMVADGFHSFADGGSNIIGLVGIWVASKPVDKDHLYGHKKYETFASTGIAMLLLLAAFHILQNSIRRFYAPVIPKVNIASYIVMGVTMAINIAVAVYEYKKGKKTNSDILISDSMHTVTDIFTSLSVIIALIAVKLGYPLIDTLISIVIALFIIYAAFKILRESSRVLCDTAVLDVKEIQAVVKNIEGVYGVHKIRSRGRIDDIYIDLHVLVKDDMHMDKAHDLSYEIENQIKKTFSGVTDIVVHLEPIGRRRRI